MADLGWSYDKKENCFKRINELALYSYNQEEILKSNHRIGMSRDEWHAVHKEFCWLYFGKECTNCTTFLKKKSDAAVHHNTYTHEGGIYNASPEELIMLNKITLLCHECHEAIHRETRIDGKTKIIKHSKCIQCGEEAEYTYIYEDGYCQYCKQMYDDLISEYEPD